MAPMGLTRHRLAKAIGVPAPRIGDIVGGIRSMTEVMAGLSLIIGQEGDSARSISFLD